MNTLLIRNMLPIEALEIFDNGIPSIIEELTSSVRELNTTSKLDWDPLPLVLEAVDEARPKLQKAVTDWEKPEDFVGIQFYLDRIGHLHQGSLLVYFNELLTLHLIKNYHNIH